MAKKKTTGRPKGGAERLSVFNLRGSPDYKAWLDEISKRSLIPVTVIMRDAVAKWAKERGYPSPPEV
jgi:hypothetical protein